MTLHSAPTGHPIDVAVIGTGYVGLTTAACLAHLGRRVVAVDIDTTKVEALGKGEVPILEAGLETLVAEGLESKRLHFTTDLERGASAPIVMLCLPTPYKEGEGLDLSYIEQAAATLRPMLAPDTIVVTKSTVPVGTHAQLSTWLDRPDLHVAANPEFLREGTAVADFLDPDRIVVGATTDRTGTRVAALYEGIDAPRQITDPTSAELIKYAANAFLATKLSFVNELSRLCDALGGNIAAVTDGVGSDHRIGSAFLQPGPGWGGSCFPKDTQGLTYLARAAGQHLPVAEAAHASNQVHLDHITETIARHCPKPLENARIAVWGATFKAGTDDTRDSPAIEIVNRLIDRGASVVVHDPAADPDDVPGEVVEQLYSACQDADLLAVLTEWSDFADADLDKVAGLLRSAIICDTRNVIDPKRAAAAGIGLYQTGRPRIGA